MLDLVQPDDCCGARLGVALMEGLTGDNWVCPRCGVEWRPRLVEGVRWWEPHEVFEIWRR